MDTLYDAIKNNEEHFDQVVYDAVKHSFKELGPDKISQLNWSWDWTYNIPNDEV